jgi:hypothetical protein
VSWHPRKPPRYVVVVSLLVLCVLAAKSTPAVPAGEARDAPVQPPAAYLSAGDPSTHV